MGHTSPDNLKNYFRLYELIKLAIKTRFLILVGDCGSAGVVQPNGDDLLQQLVVRNSGMLSRIGKIFVVRNLRIRVRFQQVKLPFFGHAIVQSRVATQEKIAIDALR